MQMSFTGRHGMRYYRLQNTVNTKSLMNEFFPRVFKESFQRIDMMFLAPRYPVALNFC